MFFFLCCRLCRIQISLGSDEYSTCVNLVSIKFSLGLYAYYMKCISRQILASGVLQSRHKDTGIALATNMGQRLESQLNLYIENCRVKSCEFSEKFGVEFSMF